MKKRNAIKLVGWCDSLLLILMPVTIYFFMVGDTENVIYLITLFLGLGVIVISAVVKKLYRISSVNK